MSIREAYAENYRYMREEWPGAIGADRQLALCPFTQHVKDAWISANRPQFTGWRNKERHQKWLKRYGELAYQAVVTNGFICTSERPNPFARDARPTFPSSVMRVLASEGKVALEVAWTSLSMHGDVVDRERYGLRDDSEARR